MPSFSQIKVPRPTNIPLVLGVFCLLLATATQATTARIAALGGRADFFTDEANTTRWSAILSDYPDLITFDSGHFDPGHGYLRDMGIGPSGPGLGVHATLRPSRNWGTLGVFFNGREADVDPGTLHQSQLTNVVTGIYSRRFGRATTAVHYRRATSTSSAPTSVTLSSQTLSTTRNDLGAGLRFILGTHVLWDFAGEARESSQNSSPAGAGTFDETSPAWGSFNIRSRSFINLNNQWTVVVLAAYMRENLSMLAGENALGTPVNMDSHLVQFGTGLNLFPDPDQMWILSAELLSATDKAPTNEQPGLRGSTLIDHALVIRLAHETRLNPWLTARASTGLDMITADSGIENRDSNHIPLSVGLSVSAARAALDLSLSDRRPATVSRLALVDDRHDDSFWLTIDIRYRFKP